MDKQKQKKINRYIKKHRLDDILETFFKTGDIDTEVYVAEKILFSADYLNVSSIAILEKMSINGFQDLIRNRLNSISLGLFLDILTTKEVSCKLDSSNLKELFAILFDTNIIISKMEALKKAYDEKKIKLFNIDFMDALKERINELCDDLDNLLDFYIEKDMFKECDIIFDIDEFKKHIFESKDINYIISFLYFSDHEAKHELYEECMNSLDILDEDKLKLKYYYCALIDTSKLSEFKNIEDVFIGAALYDNYNPITDEEDLIETIYENIGLAKMDEYKDDLDKKIKESKKAYYKKQKASLFKKSAE